MPAETLENELEHMFREDLLIACQYWGIEISGSASGTKLTELLAKKMRSKEARSRIFATFSDKEKDLLGMLTLNGGAMSYDRLKPFRKIYSYGQLNQTERDLRKKGIIIRRVMSRLTEHGREVAEFKILDFFIPHLKEYFSRKPEGEFTEAKKTRNVVNERDALLMDMLILASYLQKNEVRMTTSWEFPKRDIDRIREAMSNTTEERFDLIQRTARKAGVYSIIEDDRVVPGKVNAVFSGKQEVVSRKILLSALGRTRAIWATPDQPTEYTLNLIICKLRESSVGEWISISEMKEWIRTELFLNKQPLKWIQVDEERVSLAMETPILLGLIEATYKGRNLLAVSLTPVGEAVVRDELLPRLESHDTFIVQPNFEVTVFTTEMDYAKIYKLMLFTEPVKTDVVSACRITEGSIFQAIELGVRENEILSFLENESSKPVPANVARSIQDWTSSSIFADVSDVRLFETENEQDLESLLLLGDFKEHVVRQVGPNAVIISGDLEDLTEKLKAHKCHISKSAERKTLEQGDESTMIAEEVLLYADSGSEDIPIECKGCPALHSCNRMVRKKAKSKEK